MSSWKECKLGDIAEIKGGKRLPKGELLVTEKTPHPYIRITDFNGHKINLSAIQYVTEEVQKSISSFSFSFSGSVSDTCINATNGKPSLIKPFN